MKKLLLTTLAFVITACSPATNNTTANTTNTTTTTATTPGVSTTVAVTPGDTAPPAGDGEVVTIETVGVTYKIPAGWKKNPNNTLTAPDDSFAVAIIETTEDDPKVVAGKLDQLLGSLMTDIKVTGDQTSHEVNGINSVSVEGTGKLKEGGKDVEWAVELMQAKKILVLVEFFEPGSYEKHQASFDQFENSFDAAGGGAAATPDAAGTETPEAAGTETPEASGTPEE